MEEAKKTKRNYQVRISSRVKKLLKNKTKPYQKYGFDIEAVEKVYKRGVVEWMVYPRTGVDRMTWALGRVSAFLGGLSKKDDDLKPSGYSSQDVRG